MTADRRLTVAAALAAACTAMLQPNPAPASIFCPPKKTSDGFVALRAGPNPTARLIARMRPKDEVQIGQDRKGKWVQVTWWRSDDRLAKPQQPPAGHGWTHRDLIDECG